MLGLENIRQLGGIEIYNNPQLTSLDAIAANIAAQNSIFPGNTVSSVLVRDNNQLTDVSILRQAKTISGISVLERLYDIDK